MGFYSLWGQPQMPASLKNNDPNPYTLGVQFQVTQSATLTGVWFLSPGQATVLPQTIALYTVSGRTLVASQTATWSNSPGLGWVRATFSTPISLTANTSYKVCVLQTTGVNWFGATDNYWTTGSGASGITSAPLLAPNSTHSDGGQCTYNPGATLAYPLSNNVGDNYWISPEVQASLPITYQQIDGGPNFYGDNGYTYAHNAGWDDPSFFPIGDDYSFYPGNSTATFLDLGLNFTHRVTNSTDLSVLRAAGIWALPAPGEGTNFGSETIGWHIEEPSSWSDIETQVQSTGSLASGRLFQISNTWNQFVYGGYSGTPGGATMQNVMSASISTSAGNVHLAVPGDDIYWFAASGQLGGQYAGGTTYGLGGANATVNQMARGSNYGDMVDMMRAWMTTYPAPVGAPYIENTDGLVGTGGREITPPELNWAVWATLIHGARWILYFGTTNNFGVTSTFGFSQSVLPGQSISMYDQAQATNGLIRSLAPVLNAPFALNYVTVNPAGYSFPVPHFVWAPGIDTMAKYYGGQFYIFACTRNSESDTNISATFTTADGYTGPIEVINENRNVQATNGVFSDTFATAATVHIYKIGAPVPAGAGVLRRPIMTGIL